MSTKESNLEYLVEGLETFESIRTNHYKRMKRHNLKFGLLQFAAMSI